LIWRSEGKAWIRDLGSSNGTTVDGMPIGDRPVALSSGSVVSFADHRYRFIEA
jgi:pSer/pThr/pTyr-binding forkhead associated (FHA) protein